LVEHANSVPTIAAHPNHLEIRFMVLILLEALAALLLLVGIVWWTMFSGRTKGELPAAEPTDAHEDGTPPKG
jgi:cytoskeletal protein RodZ